MSKASLDALFPASLSEKNPEVSFKNWRVVLQVFYPDEDSEAAVTCEAWHGDVTGILSHDQAGAGEEVVQADPYGCGGLWERFLVGWQPRPQVCPRLVIDHEP